MWLRNNATFAAFIFLRLSLKWLQDVGLRWQKDIMFCLLLDADECCVEKKNTLTSQVMRNFLKNLSDPVLKCPGLIVAMKVVFS